MKPPCGLYAPEYRTIAAMRVEPADVAGKLQVTDDEIAASYEQRKSDYFTPEKRTILQLGFPDVAKAEAAKKRIDGARTSSRLPQRWAQRKAHHLRRQDQG